MTGTPEREARATEPYLTADDEARAMARTLAAEARTGALATLDATDGLPLATRVGVAREPGGDMLMLLSDLSDHTKALRAHPAASMLLGSVGKGDPLAQPRLTLRGDVSRIEPGAMDHAAARARYLARQPKAALYADFADFGFYRLRIRSALLNGGFARAYRMERTDLCRAVPADLLSRERTVIDHMNADHADSLQAMIHHQRGVAGEAWRIVALDPIGFEVQLGDDVVRLEFALPVQTASGYRDAFVTLARATQNST
ncbi:HugZ family pyridoxamine 5'-phosphate oxidase [Aureimonas sp. AU40]|uniref:HugZ family pyridoxamine 5'-phosphate oxidase n=1 Tax=Aureimonas sp. AU40 TaxID=1637747 RepID=UPI000784E85B|nr:DUF2470 domain-containing protein [Aureimonas sp. AU40]